jgi:hypothetical protein
MAAAKNGRQPKSGQPQKLTATKLATLMSL